MLLNISVYIQSNVQCKSFAILTFYYHSKALHSGKSWATFGSLILGTDGFEGMPSGRTHARGVVEEGIAAACRIQACARSGLASTKAEKLRKRNAKKAAKDKTERDAIILIQRVERGHQARSHAFAKLAEINKPSRENRGAARLLKQAGKKAAVQVRVYHW